MAGQIMHFAGHRVAPSDVSAVSRGTVRWSPAKSFWFLGMTVLGFGGGIVVFSWTAFAIYLGATASRS
jgi:stearoyl-CoA desaturase (delta-9 desaturase)